MKRILAAIAMLLIGATGASAQTQIITTSMTCAQLTAAMNANGRALLRYTSRNGLPIYDRYVSNSGYCGVNQTLQPYSVPTRDQQKCRVYKCISNSND